MTWALGEQSLDQVFRSALTPNGWTDRPVEDDTLREVYDLMKMGASICEQQPGAAYPGA